VRGRADGSDAARQHPYALPAPIAASLNSLASTTQGIVFGGALVLGDDVLAALNAAIG